jgi:hypothetical protein
VVQPKALVQPGPRSASALPVLAVLVMIGARHKIDDRGLDRLRRRGLMD